MEICVIAVQWNIFLCNEIASEDNNGHNTVIYLKSDDENVLEQRLDAGSVNFESMRQRYKRDYIKRKDNTVVSFVVCFVQKYNNVRFPHFLT